MTIDKNVERELETARTLAESGRVPGMESCFLSVQRYARREKDISEQEREDISEQITEIGNMGYGNGVQAHLKVARTFAESNNILGTENYLSYAQGYATIMGQDISEQVDQIRSSIQKD